MTKEEYDRLIKPKMIRLAIADRLNWEEFGPSFFERLEDALGEYDINITDSWINDQDESGGAYKANPDPINMELEIWVEIEGLEQPMGTGNRIAIEWYKDRFDIDLNNSDMSWRTGDNGEITLDDHIDTLTDIIRFDVKDELENPSI